ncbi:hypothetical protein SAMN05444392_101265 [Seinonella peptonophila]|uniref:Uncharacterized protein n=1 Tax=Seinonella peptonophila TaxID=112248 RepID=A0A1M4T1X6_9BACL|nr:hypothetical protein SAMN05444392_101265 [Seinonella peptonophila]
MYLFDMKFLDPNILNPRFSFWNSENIPLFGKLHFTVQLLVLLLLKKRFFYILTSEITEVFFLSLKLTLSHLFHTF